METKRYWIWSFINDGKWIIDSYYRDEQGFSTNGVYASDWEFLVKKKNEDLWIDL